MGFEPMASWITTRRSASELRTPCKVPCCGLRYQVANLTSVGSLALPSPRVPTLELPQCNQPDRLLPRGKSASSSSASYFTPVAGGCSLSLVLALSAPSGVPGSAAPIRFVQTTQDSGESLVAIPTLTRLAPVVVIAANDLF